MGYRTSERLPLIAASPDNSGLYQDLFTEASKRVGCELNIVRLPKQRILAGLESGMIDFYPGFTYTSSRSKFTYFIPNGLTLSTRVISHTDSKEILKKEDMQGGIMLRANGGPSFGMEKYGVTMTTIENLDLPRAIAMIEQKRVDYYMYFSSTIKYYLKTHPTNKIKLNPCCGAPEEMFLGFSRYSPHYSETSNSAYNTKQPLSPNNLPYVITPDSMPDRLHKAINELREEGFIEGLVKQYYD